MKYILTFDQGTSSSRAILFDRAGDIRAAAQQEFRQIFPAPGWVEHDPDAIWNTQLEVARSAIREAGCSPKEIAALGITNQRETTVVWDRDTGQPVYNAIVWQDRRTAGFCDRLKALGHEAMVRDRTGLLLDPYFSASKLHWILENVKGARAKAEAGRLAFGTIDSWLVWNLTGGRLHLTDATNASRTLLYHIRNGCWDETLLALFGVPPSLLPEIRPSSEVYADTLPELFGKAVPIAGIGGDQQSALFGQACNRPGMAKNTYGTGCFMLMYTGENAVASPSKLLTTAACRTGPDLKYALEGSVFVAGAAVQWLRDGLGILKTSAEVEGLAGEVEDSGDVYFVPAFTGLGAPYWDPYARGTLIGMTLGTTRAHVARATLESMAHQTADVLEAMESDAGIRLKELRADGGATVNDLLMQIQADVIGVPVVRPRIRETTALGAAYLSGLAVGFWKDEAEIGEHWREERRFLPQITEGQRLEMRARWKKAVQQARGWTAPSSSA